MRSKSTRREVLKLAGAAAMAGIAPRGAFAQAAGQVVVVGAGFGGATAAKYLRRAGVNVTLVEQNTNFVTCPFSNTVLAGLNEIGAVTQTFAGLTKAGVQVVQDTATKIDATAKTVTLARGSPIRYDRLVLSPGIDFKWNAIPGYDEAASAVLPHAWKAGPQTELLRRQLIAMDDGGVVIITSPPNPFRCPPGPYERASLIASYLKASKPRSKIIILDAKDTFSKQALFQQGWQALYPGMVEWVAFGQGGNVARVDVANKTVFTDFGSHKGAVINIIPPQWANRLVDTAGLTDASGWCPVNQATFESKTAPGVHVIGDASVAGALPKSGFAANNEAKVCAAAVAALLKGAAPPSPSFINVCYSLMAKDYGISVAGVYRVADDGMITQVMGSGGNSAADATPETRKLEADYARGWYTSIAGDIWG